MNYSRAVSGDEFSGSGTANATLIAAFTPDQISLRFFGGFAATGHLSGDAGCGGGASSGGDAQIQSFFALDRAVVAEVSVVMSPAAQGQSGTRGSSVRYNLFGSNFTGLPGANCGSISSIPRQFTGGHDAAQHDYCGPWVRIEDRNATFNVMLGAGGYSLESVEAGWVSGLSPGSDNISVGHYVHVRIVAPCTTVLEEPIPATHCPGEAAAFTFRVEGISSLTRQWRRDGFAIVDGPTATGSVISGATAETLVITNVRLEDAGVYDCVVSSPIGACTDSTSQPATLDVGESCCTVIFDPKGTFLRVNGDPNSAPPSIVNLADCGISCGRQVRVTSLNGYYPCGDTNNPQKDAIGVFSATSTVLASNQQFRVPGAIASSNNIPIVTGPTPIGGFPTDIPQDFLIHDGDAVNVPCGANFLLLAPRPGLCSPGSNEPVDPDDRRGRIIPCGPPTISEQPESSVACIGSTVTFSLVAANWRPWTYRWRINGVPISTAINSTAETASLRLMNVQLADTELSYDCVVTNSCGTVTSHSVTITICIGDHNCDGGIDGADIGAFFSNWQAGNYAADVNADGGIDGADVSSFFEHWEAGC
ncbi:MAG: immunoglobulin domain-containing protein [Planctomycetes bacterium]|nr:immunoglobulin domain-containing protein [Planctomycetota bacterium]